jgi:hypothetical protein
VKIKLAEIERISVEFCTIPDEYYAGIDFRQRRNKKSALAAWYSGHRIPFESRQGVRLFRNLYIAVLLS